MCGFLMRREKLLSKIRADENMDQTGERIVYLCDDIEGKFAENNETSESRYFSIDSLPPFAEEKWNFDAFWTKTWTAVYD